MRCTRLLLPIEAALQDLAALSVGQNDAARLLRGQAVLIRGRDAPTDDRPDLCNLQGPPDRRRPHREGRAAPDPRVQFRQRWLICAVIGL